MYPGTAMITFFSESEIPEVEAQLDALNIKYESSQMSCFSVNAGTYAVLCIQYGLLPAVSGIIGAWLMAQNNRRVRMRIGQNEFDARNIKEMEKLIELSQTIETKKGDTHEVPPLEIATKPPELIPDSRKPVEP